MMRFSLFLLLGLAAIGIGNDPFASAPAGPAPASGFRLPPGFVIEKVAGPPVVLHPMMGGFDERGRLFLAESAGQNLQAGDLRKLLPNFMRVLEPADEAGHFAKSSVFADKMTFPMGALWHRGALYAGSSGGLWRLQDTKGTGVADARQELVSKFGYTGNAADIHGPFLGPDGRLYWCDGRHGHEIARPDGSVMKGKAARIFRCKPDGTEVEVVCGGGMDNPVEIAFTDECEPLVTVDLLHAQPARNDGIIYAIEGGVYPWHEVYREFPRTGALLPAVANLGWVAPSGLMRYRSATFGKDYQGNLFSAQFNRGRIQRHVLERDGATFRTRTEDFLVTSDKSFHPTDVLEDADGSMLVIDTGGWFRIGCPTSKIAQPEIRGGIYRIRKQAGPAVNDPRGLKLAWPRMTPAELAALLDDGRFCVRDRAVDELAQRGKEALADLQAVLKGSTSSRACRNAVWALTRIDLPEARLAVRRVLRDKDMSVRLAAIHSVGLWRDQQALAGLLELVVKDEPALRRQAATALGRLARAEAVPALIESLRAGGDRFLEHACIYALIRIGSRNDLVGFLKDVSPQVRRAALIALDQMPEGELTRDLVTPLLETTDPALLATVLEVIGVAAELGGEIVALARSWLGEANLDAVRLESLRGLLSNLSKENVIQELVAQTLRQPKTGEAVRLMLLETMGRASVAKFPATWTTELERALKQGEDAVAQQTIAVVRSRQMTGFDAALVDLAHDGRRPTEVRLAALAAAAPRVKRLDDELLQFLLSQLQPDRPPLGRLAAASALGQVRLDDRQLERLLPVLPSAGALEMTPLLGAFERSQDADIGRRLLQALAKAPGLTSLSPTALERAFAGFAPEIRKQATALAGKLFVDAGKQKARLDELSPALTGGDAGRGRSVFYGAKASCGACHTVKNEGGRIGPDLSSIGAIRSGRDLLESLVFPNASFARGFEPYVVETRSGKVHTGVLTRESADAVFLVTAERTEIRIPRTEIDALAPGRVSIMPQGLDAQLSADELRDLLAYLQGLR